MAGWHTAPMSLPLDIQYPDLGSPYDDALRQAISFVFDHEAPIVGVVVAGSVVRGEADERSDLDVYVIVEGTLRQRRQRRFLGVPCEMFFNPVERIPRYLVDERLRGEGSATSMLAYGFIMHDPTRVMARMQQEAQRSHESGPTVSDETVRLRSYLIVDRLDNARDIADRDPALSAAMTGAVVVDVLKLAHAKLGIWIPRDKDLHWSVLQHHPELEVLLAAYGRQPDAESAAAIVKAIVGVAGFFAWDSAPEPID